MRDYAKEFENRVAFIRDLLKSSGAKGVIYGNSGGKDSALVGILCKAACDNTVGIIIGNLLGAEEYDRARNYCPKLAALSCAASIFLAR